MHQCRDGNHSSVCREKKEKRKHGKRTKTDAEKVIELERRQAAEGKLTRSAQTRHWIDDGFGFYIDSHGDADNLAFDGLYRANIAAYNRYDPTMFAKGTKPRYGYAYGQR